jgi:CheY-like chemotaxis protein
LQVLLVDDDHNDRAIFGLAADRTDLDLWLQTASGAQQAMDYLEGHGTYADRAMHPIPDLLLLDLKMPGMDGFEFLTWLRASSKFAALPVVIFSGSENKHERERAMKLGANHVVTKPFDFDHWKAVVREVWEFGTNLKAGVPLPAKG